MGEKTTATPLDATPRCGTGSRPKPRTLPPLLAAVAMVLLTVGPAGAAVSVQEFEVARSATDNLDPAVSGDVVVWAAVDEQNSLSDIEGKNLLTGEQLQITADPPADPRDQRRPDISRGVVVWEDDRNGDWDVFGKDLTRGGEFRTTTDARDQRRPALSSNVVVWEDYRNGNSDIRGKNLRTGRQLRITDHPDFQDTPAISGINVVWRDDRNRGHYDILGRNLKTNRSFRVVGGTQDQVSPAVSGGIVVWTDWRGGNPDVFGKNLSSGEVFEVAQAAGPQESPDINGDTVVWESQGTGDPDFGVWKILGATLDLGQATPSRGAGLQG